MTLSQIEVIAVYEVRRMGRRNGFELGTIDRSLYR